MSRADIVLHAQDPNISPKPAQIESVGVGPKAEAAVKAAVKAAAAIAATKTAEANTAKAAAKSDSNSNSSQSSSSSQNSGSNEARTVKVSVHSPLAFITRTHAANRCE